MVATLINSQVVGSAKHAKIFPHVGEDGQYPKEFNTPKTVEMMRVLDSALNPSPPHEFPSNASHH